MASTKREKTCALCGSHGTSANQITREHVPPKQFFPKALRSQRNLNLWVVPTCRKCNESYKSDEEYFYVALYPLVANSNRQMSVTILDDIRRRGNKPQTPALLKSVLKSSTIRTKSGIVMPPGVVQLSVDEFRIQQVAIKIARCLFYRDHGQVLPADNCCDIRLCESETAVPDMYSLSWEFSKTFVERDTSPNTALHIVDESDAEGHATSEYTKVFSYRTAHIDNLHLYSLLFWEAFMFCLAFTAPEAVATESD